MSIARSAQPLSPAVWRYGMPAIVLHWVLALLITFLVVLGWSMMTVERQPDGKAVAPFRNLHGRLLGYTVESLYINAI